MLGRLIHVLRRRIAVKLTLTLLGFVAVTVLAAGLYLNHALERLAVESLEMRLATAGALIQGQALTLLTTEASPDALRVARPFGSGSQLGSAAVQPSGRV